MLEFRESTDYGYKERTIENASADATLAFAVDFNTSGEKLTKKSVEQQGKLYFAVDINSMKAISSSDIMIISKNFNEHEVEILNIAGNGLYTLKKKATHNQSQLDNYVYNFLSRLFKYLNKKIEVIRTGGQTGADEAGAKAGVKLGIDTLIYAPRGWKFRGEDGIDVSNEKLFKARFL